MHHSIPLGTTEPQDFALVDQGDPFDGTGVTVTLEVWKLVSGVLTAVTPPSVAWLAADEGTVRVTGVGALVEGSYRVRFKLTAGSSVGYCPNGKKADVWEVVAVGNA